MCKKELEQGIFNLYKTITYDIEVEAFLDIFDTTPFGGSYNKECIKKVMQWTQKITATEFEDPETLEEAFALSTGKLQKFNEIPESDRDACFIGMFYDSEWEKVLMKAIASYIADEYLSGNSTLLTSVLDCAKKEYTEDRQITFLNKAIMSIYNIIGAIPVTATVGSPRW